VIINEKKTEELIHKNEAGEWMLNIYYGCDLVCPYCYWQTDEKWANQITVYTDVAERLKEEIREIPRHTKIGLGWKGNPYTSIEKEYGLTRKCLQLLLDNDMSVTVSASRGNDIILRDLDLLTRPGADVRVLIEMTRLDIVKEFNESGTHVSFQVANELRRKGINIITTVSPVMPGITDVEKMAAALPGIPVHIAKLDIRPGTMWGIKTLEYVKENYPGLFPMYEEISRTGVDPYFEGLKEKYKDGLGQIRPYLPFWDEIPEK
jgi:DNA repair photolyase